MIGSFTDVIFVMSQLVACRSIHYEPVAISFRTVMYSYVLFRYYCRLLITYHARHNIIIMFSLCIAHCHVEYYLTQPATWNHFATVLTQPACHVEILMIEYKTTDNQDMQERCIYTSSRAPLTFAEHNSRHQQ